MATHHYPILVWQDAGGATTAATIGDFETVAACAATDKEALQQLREFLEWKLENEPWSADPDFTQPALQEVKVEVRPQYRLRRHIVPCPETVWLRVPCVTGLQENGMRLCVIPHFSLQFTFQDGADLRGLVAHYVKESLQSLSPAQLAGSLPPRGCRLEEMVLRDAGRVRVVPPADRPELKILFSVASPVLQNVGRQRAGSAAYGREVLVATLARKLEREKANVLLVGESGVGKSTVLLHAVKGIGREARARTEDGNSEELGNAARELRGYRFWRGSGGRMIAGMRYLGEWEERCEEFIGQLASIEGVFCAESLLELVQVGGQGSGNSVAAFLLSYLQRGELRIVAEATSQEVEACRRLLPGLLDVFQIVQVPVFDDAAAVQVLDRVASACAAGAKLEVEPGVVSLVHRLHKRFKPYASFPGPAANFMRNLCDARSGAPRRDQQSVSPQDAVNLFIQQTGLPEIFLRDELLLRLEEVRECFAGQIIGQPEATLAAARLVTTIKAGLTDPGRPMGVLLFAGPTGVGKTALAKTLVDYCFGAGGQKDRLVRLDMSEYAGWGAAQRLLQNPQGHPAAWIERVRRQPFCVLLFDEIEKAAPEVFDVLLGLLDEGRLTDRFGRVTWFRSSIILMTSNLGTSAPTSAGFAAAPTASFESEVAKFFRPEFFNRLDAVITFKSLAPAEVEAVTRKELADLAGREGLQSSGIRLAWTDAAVAAVAREGYDQRLGARPLQRALERLVATPLARWKVANPLARDTTLLIDLDSQGSIVLRREAGNQPLR